MTAPDRGLREQINAAAHAWLHDPGEHDSLGDALIAGPLAEPLAALARVADLADRYERADPDLGRSVAAAIRAALQGAGS